MFGYLINEETLTIFCEGEVLSITKDQESAWEKAVELIKEGCESLVEYQKLMNKAAMVSTYMQGTLVRVEGGSVTLNGVPVTGVLVDKIISFAEKELPVEPLINFLIRIEKNPSYKSRQALFGFLEKYNAPITKEGKFVAWKNVRSDFTDIHSGTFDNSPGSVVTMPRNMVDDDNNRTCSAGLHACASVYLKSFYVNGGKTIAVEIDPQDVVAIPTDYNSAKMRVCKYKVLQEVENQNIPEMESWDIWMDVDLEDDYSEEDYEEGGWYSA